jgi:asparagine synthase (glutamine-hydrolysing)
MLRDATEGLIVTAIAGFIGRNATEETVSRMLEKIHHRGRTEQNVFRVPGGVVGSVEMADMRRSTHSPSPTVLLDGVLYNERKNGKTDAEYIEEQFAYAGRNALSGLDGSFSCALISGDETLLARDSVGARPLIYGLCPDGGLCFASEAKALCGVVDTVKELPPGHVYSTKNGLHTFVPYTPEVPDFNTPEEAAAILRELVIHAVGKSITGGRAGVALSGGLDSSIILAAARECTPRIETFSVTIKENPGADFQYAEMMARYTGAALHTYRLTANDIREILPEAVWLLESFDEDCIAGFVANYYASRLASEFTDTVLVGEGADELFGGYFGELETDYDETEKESVAKKLMDIAYNTSLRRLDRGWAANSVDYRMPFLDSAVVAFSEKIPLHLKVHKEPGRDSLPVEKWILREAFRDMLPAEIADRPKMRFARGVGVDDMMDAAVGEKVTPGEFSDTRMSKGGIPFNSPKELYFYTLFREYFPPGYDSLSARWDPEK